jgi:carotenoid cleavage dioxygenase-like enzyme
MNNGTSQGFTTLSEEWQVEELPVQGKVPEWLSGRLLRTGPAQFEVGDQRYNHWFDGLAMLHRFGFDGGRVSYCNRFLHSRTFRDNRAASAIRHGEFATEPRRALWRRIRDTMTSPDFSDNANVAVAPLGGHVAALTETPTPIAFDPETLATLGPLDYGGDIPTMVTTAHPRFDFSRRETLNITTNFARHSHYHIYKMPAGSLARELITSVEVKRPGYMHSFAVTPRYVILLEWPLTVNPLKLAASPLTGKPFIDNYRWDGDADSRLLVIERQTGKLRHETAAPTGFAFHQVNAWEEGDDIVVDLCLYDDAGIIECCRLAHLRDPDTTFPTAKLTRLRIQPGGAVGLESGSTLGAILGSAKPALSPGLVDGDGDRVGEIEAAAAGLHGQAQGAPAGRTQARIRQAAGFRAEQQDIAGLKANVGIAPAGAG